MTRFSVALPRKMFWSKDIGGTSQCPECGAELEHEYHSYLLALCEDGEVQPFIVGSDAGYFCETCPVVVLDHEAFGKLAGLGSGHQDDGMFNVMGFVNWDAVPEEKSHVPLGEDDNPIPLVQFSNLKLEQLAGSTRKRHKSKRKRRKKKRK